MTFKLDGIDTLFPIPLWRYTVAGHDKLNPRLLEEIKVRQGADPDIATRNRNGWQSRHDFFNRQEPAHAELAAIVRKVMADALSKVASQVKADKINFHQDGWINVNPPHGYIGPHVHPNALLSGTYYVSVPQGEGAGGQIEFVSPHPVGHMSGWIKAAMLTDKVRVQPREGQILLFPAQLLHWVLPNTSTQDRVTISFNLAARMRPGVRLG